MGILLKIAFNLPLYGTYDYIAPEGTNNIKIGMRVETYFGRKRLIGIVGEIKNIESNSFLVNFFIR